jgi:hypothetical protein
VALPPQAVLCVKVDVGVSEGGEGEGEEEEEEKGLQGFMQLTKL